MDDVFKVVILLKGSVKDGGLAFLEIFHTANWDNSLPELDSHGWNSKISQQSPEQSQAVIYRNLIQKSRN